MAPDRTSKESSGAHRRLRDSILRRASATQKHSDVVIFLFFAVLGGAIEIAAHNFTDSAIWIILGPVVVLMTYLATSLSLRRFRLRLDQIGDNCYYMGFLFTLVALSLALSDFRGGQSFQIGTIVANFGVALASTILGVLLRVALSQMREDPVEVEEQSRLELAIAANELKSELYASTREMASFRGMMQQSIVESYKDVSAESRKAILKAANELSDATGAINEKIADRTALIGERLDGFNELTARSVASLRTLVEDMERLRPPNEAINDIFDKTADVMGKISSNAQEIYEINEKQRQQAELTLATTINSVKTVSESLAGLAGDQSPLNEVIDNLGKAAASVTTLSAGFAESGNALSGSIETHRNSIESHKNISAESVRVITEHNAEVAKALQSSRSMLAEVEKNLSEMAQALARSVA